MKALLKVPAVALATIAMVGQSLAADMCAKPEEAMALKAAALQQELMVAALTCDDVGPYNHFVVSYQRELQQSDAALLTYFQRTSAGAEKYNAYKTALANNFSLASLRGKQEFCGAADIAFGEAFGRAGSLARFVATEPVAGTEAYPTCAESGEQTEVVAGGSSAGRQRLATDMRN